MFIFFLLAILLNLKYIDCFGGGFGAPKKDSFKYTGSLRPGKKTTKRKVPKSIEMMSSTPEFPRFSNLLNLETLNAGILVQELSSLKNENIISQFNSTLLEPYRVTKLDLYTISRTTWSTEDLLTDILNAGSGNTKDNEDLKLKFIAASVASVLISAFIIPFLNVNSSFKNILESMFLFGPFISILLYLTIPSLFEAKENEIKNIERKCTHEAGHIIVGDCCGIPVLSYNVYNSDYSTLIEYPVNLNYNNNDDNNSNSSGNSNIESYGSYGNLLVVSVAGIIAEMLRFGDSKGGASDLPLAYQIISTSFKSNTNQSGNTKYSLFSYEDFLRWSLVKAIFILRTNRDALDIVSEQIYNDEPLAAILETVEDMNFNGL